MVKRACGFAHREAIKDGLLTFLRELEEAYADIESEVSWDAYHVKLFVRTSFEKWMNSSSSIPFDEAKQWVDHCQSLKVFSQIK